MWALRSYTAASDPRPAVWRRLAPTRAPPARSRFLRLVNARDPLPSFARRRRSTRIDRARRRPGRSVEILIGPAKRKRSGPVSIVRCVAADQFELLAWLAEREEKNPGALPTGSDVRIHAAHLDRDGQQGSLAVSQALARLRGQGWISRVFMAWPNRPAEPPAHMIDDTSTTAPGQHTPNTSPPCATARRSGLTALASASAGTMPELPGCIAAAAAGIER